jgi:hypothetical protein
MIEKSEENKEMYNQYRMLSITYIPNETYKPVKMPECKKKNAG